MPYREFHYRWEWQLRASPGALWPFVADTNRFNRDTGLAPVEYLRGDGPRPSNARRHLRLVQFGITVEWEEFPFEWIRPSRFGVVRQYRKGPLAELRVLAELTPQPGGGSRLVYQVWARPRSLLGLIAIPLQIGVLSARRFDATIRRYDQLAAEAKSPLDLPARGRLAPGGGERLASLRQALLAQGAAPDLLARLIETIEEADDLTLARMRPYALADHWGVPRRPVLELCLTATRAGLLDMRWDLLCPLCRGANHSSPSLADIQTQVHCESCNIDFTANFDRSVELTFRPTPAVRPIEYREFCVGGPQVTPHIVAQQLLPSGARRTLTPPLEPGRYRLRALELPGGHSLVVGPDGLSEATLRASGAGWPQEELSLGPTPTLTLENATESERLLILERMVWTDQATMAAEVIALQRFRDLFSREMLRPGQEVSVGSLAVVFTDLRGSTRLYREIGDAPAFGRVMSHFDVLRQAIAAEDGALVKTIGDAVMAVFRSPLAALRAILAARQALAASSQAAPPLCLKAGIHYGPCIAVTLNDQLDYFGATVNIAARLVGLSAGEDVVVSAAVRDDPEVADWLTLTKRSLIVEPIEATLKGFDAERFNLWRVRPLLTAASQRQREG
jgi:class 3 adenylate cyclase